MIQLFMYCHIIFRIFHIFFRSYFDNTIKTVILLVYCIFAFFFDTKSTITNYVNWLMLVYILLQSSKILFVKMIRFTLKTDSRPSSISLKLLFRQSNNNGDDIPPNFRVYVEQNRYLFHWKSQNMITRKRQIWAFI